MIFRQSLKNRIKIAFSGFGIILALFYWALLDISVNLAEDMIFENRLRNETSAFLDRYRENPDATLPFSAYIQSYIGKENVPQPFQVTIENISPGYYETDGPTALKGPIDFHVGITPIPGSDQSFYIFFDVGTLKVAEKFETIFRTFLLFSTIAVALMGGGIGGLMARRVIAPVTELADQVAKTDPDNLSVNLSKRFAEDEVGFLAKTLEQSMLRLQAFVDREKAFTRDASHELRTPVTVIKGALELIVQLPAYKDAALKRPLQRIERSALRMSGTIETFLWLAREETGPEEKQTCHVRHEVKEVFDEQALLFKEKPVTAQVVEKGSPVIQAPAGVVRIVMNNLIANAFHYTAEGRVLLIIREDGIDLLNSASMTQTTDSLLDPSVKGKESQGFGFGLAIVKRLSERFGWQLDISAQDTDVQDRGETLVRLRFH